MAVRMWDEMTWEEMRDLPRSATVAILPVGAIEAHGPHLPLATDLIISSAMAARGASNLAARGVEAVILPALPYGAAPFAAAFPGTIPVNASTVAALVTEIGTALRAQSLHWLAVANAHLDPAHLDSLRAAAREASERDSVRIIFPDLTEKPWALRLGEEFRSGACHAGRFESSRARAGRHAPRPAGGHRLTFTRDPGGSPGFCRGGRAARVFRRAGRRVAGRR